MQYVEGQTKDKYDPPLHVYRMCT